MKANAIIEVILVLSLTLFLIAAIGVSPVGEWERSMTDRFFLEYAVMIALPLLFLFASRRNLADYGISLNNLRYQLDITITGFVPVAIAAIPFAFLNYKHWDSALILAGIRIALLFALAHLLRNKPTYNQSSFLAGCGFIWIASDWSLTAIIGNALSAIVFYIFFLGLGEELLFRGYIQSRLNAAWGRPFRFYGVKWGWGVLITSASFASMHVLNLGSMVERDWQLAWPWGLWTFFGGLVFGFVREKTGNIVAPALLHGVPLAIAYAFLGL